MINLKKRHGMRRVKSKVWDEPAPAFASSDPLPIGKPPVQHKNEPHAEFQSRLLCYDHRKFKLEQDRAALTSAEIDRRLVGLLVDCGKQAREVTEADIRGLNIPLKEITPSRKARCLARAEEQFPGCKDRIYQIAA